MSFASVEFLIFFSIFIPLYFALPSRLRVGAILIASYIFYAYWNATYIFLIVGSTLIDYFVGLALERTTHQRHRQLYLATSLTTNLAVLALFKYYLFFTTTLTDIGEMIGGSWAFPTLYLVLPVGISFYTFQSMSYSIEVYRGAQKAEKSFTKFAAYIAFFPQLVAGPIERPDNILPQFDKEQSIDYQRIASGMRLILWGLVKKVVIADYLAPYVNTVYATPQSYTGLPLLIATFFFSFQIYCDFSAYSDMAIGTARVMGFKLMDNFRQPYFATSVSQFWRRWHISLSTWFRDYLYIPLGGNRVSQTRQLFNMMVVFLASGLWHGANLTFVFWGFLHGLYVVIESFLGRHRSTENRSKIATVGRIITTFLLTMLAWIFFRATTIYDGFYIVSNIFNFVGIGTSIASPIIENGSIAGGTYLITSFSLILFLLAADWVDMKYGLLDVIEKLPRAIRWAIYYTAVAMIFVALNSIDLVQDFIYFQF